MPRFCCCGFECTPKLALPATARARLLRDTLIAAMTTTGDVKVLSATGVRRPASIVSVMKSALVLLSLAAMAFASDDKTDRASLRGIKALCLVVEVTDQGQGAGNGPNQEQL